MLSGMDDDCANYATTNVADVLNKHCSSILFVENKYTTTVQPARITIIASEIFLVNKRMSCTRNGQTVSPCHTIHPCFSVTNPPVHTCRHILTLLTSRETGPAATTFPVVKFPFNDLPPVRFSPKPINRHVTKITLTHIGAGPKNVQRNFGRGTRLSETLVHTSSVCGVN
jgi:hypothetical protein